MHPYQTDLTPKNCYFLSDLCNTECVCKYGNTHSPIKCVCEFFPHTSSYACEIFDIDMIDALRRISRL